VKPAPAKAAPKTAAAAGQDKPAEGPLAARLKKLFGL
jgi:hypothetical protein